MNTDRRAFLKQTGAACLSAGAAALPVACGAPEHTAEIAGPNIILVMTDDQGNGDLGCHGNDLISTPNLDRFFAENTEFSRFYVCPTCAPTRAGLLTGRYHHRTGIMSTMSGDAMIAPDEVTVARVLASAGYRTGIFGKWHLGDSYPRRPIDMGFDEAIVHNGGGLSQPSCPPGVGYHDPTHWKKHNYILPEHLPHWMSTNNYFDPVLRHNGVYKQFEGYCTDIFVDAALDFLETHRADPFFLYLPLNAPHAPEIVSEEYLKPYRDMGLDDKTARGYAMITNIDDNFGRLLKKLGELGLEDNTILIFLTDNGAQYDRYNNGLRARKGHFYEGGIRVPFAVRWPAGFAGARTVDTIAANIDLLPTLLEACGVQMPESLSIDGASLMPVLKEESTNMPERALFFQGNNGVPEPYNQCAVVTRRYKLVNGTELYDLLEDPSEKNNIADNRPEIVADLRSRYEAWFEDVGSTRGFDPQRIYLGAPQENPVVLTPQDWRGPRSRFVREGSHGWWEVDVRNAGSYEFTVRFDKRKSPCTLRFSLGGIDDQATVPAGETAFTFEPMDVPPGESRLETWLEIEGEKVGVRYVDVKKV